MRRRAREARIDHDQLGAVLLGVQEMQHRDGVRLGRIAAEQEDRLGVVDVVEAVGHRPVAEGAGDAGDRGRVADARLVVAVVGPPHRHELAVQVGGLVGELGRPAPEDAVRPALLAQLQQLVADLGDGLVPADARPFAGGKLHGVLEPALAVGELARRRALGAVRAHVDRAFEHRLLARPHAVLDLGPDGAADRAEWADGLQAFRFTGGRLDRSLCAHARRRADRQSCEAAHRGEPGGMQEAPPRQRPANLARGNRERGRAGAEAAISSLGALAKHGLAFQRRPDRPRWPQAQKRLRS